MISLISRDYSKVTKEIKIPTTSSYAGWELSEARDLYSTWVEWIIMLKAWTNSHFYWKFRVDLRSKEAKVISGLKGKLQNILSGGVSVCVWGAGGESQNIALCWRQFIDLFLLLNLLSGEIHFRVLLNETI